MRTYSTDVQAGICLCRAYVLYSRAMRHTNNVNKTILSAFPKDFVYMGYAFIENYEKKQPRG